MKKRALILALAGIMAASLIGCGSLKDDAVVVKAGDEEITAGVANFYARYTQAQYETYFASYLGGDDMWSRNASDGKTYEESIKKTLLDDLKNMALLEEHMKDYDVKLTNKAGESVSLPELMDMDINTAVEFCKDMKTVSQKLNTLKQLGLGYLTIGEETPSLSGGEAQRLKLASEIGKIQSDSVFVFDEPSIGLHPLDVQVLLKVFQALLDNGATVIVIEHDLDVIRNADYVIDMGPGGGENGGKIIASGTPQEIKLNKKSITGRYL